MSMTNILYSKPRRLTWLEIYPVLTLLALSVAPAFLLGDGARNLGLIAFMSVSPLVVLIFLQRTALSKEALMLFGFSFSIIFFPVLGHDDTRWSTIFYTLMFCSLFISYDLMLRSGYLRITVFLKVIRNLIFAYTLMLLAQQLSVLLGLPIPNLSNYNPADPWKLNSLSSEPSQSARIFGILMLCYVIGSRIANQMGEDFKETKLQRIFLWVCFLWTMITMVSATAVVMLGIVLVAYFQRFDIRFLLPILGILAAAAFFLPDFLVERASRIAIATVTLDYREVLSADHSGGMRIAPMLVLMNYVEVFSFSGVFGHGTDSIGLFLSDYIWGVEDGFTGGGLMAMWYEIGIVSFALFVLFSFSATRVLSLPVHMLLWFVMIFIAGINTQVVWLTITLLYTLRFFSKLEQRLIRN